MRNFVPYIDWTIMHAPLTKKMLLACCCLATLAATPAYAEEHHTATSANDALKAEKRTDVTIPFTTLGEGVETPVLWGLDTAWPDEWNMVRGTTFIGKGQLAVGRVSFQPSDLIGEDGQLSEEQKKDLDERLRLMTLSGVKDIALNSDHEVLCDNEEKNFDTKEEWEAWKEKAAQHRKNYVGRPEEWIRLFKATTDYCRAKGFNVVSIAPFNEADYTAWNQGTMADFREICRLMQEDPYFEGIRVSGGNTLNCDKALEWYDGLSPYLDEGNTHQLAGSFDNYARFFETVRANGHHATADELHNVMEAIVGVEYGMQTGIWWGFDGRARGEFCRATFGRRLAYGEDRAHWTAAAIYRMPDGRVQLFGGTSERQASNSSYRIVSTDKVAYFDGYGPTHEYVMELPGGNGYQNGQTNAERVLEIHTGEDVPLASVNGTYIIMNKNSRKVLMPKDGSTARAVNLTQGSYKSKEYQQWTVAPVPSRVGGDFSYYHITNVGNGYHPNVLNGSLSNGSNIIQYNAGDNLEQWYLQYAGDSYWYIVSRHSGLCLEVAGGSTQEGAYVTQSTFNGDDRQLWRLLPTTASCEKIKPRTPTTLKATPSATTVTLTWTPSPDTDVAAYAILRAEEQTGEWNTIARDVHDTLFVDNTVAQGKTYIYKVKAIDHSQNRSAASATATATPTGERSLVAAYAFEDNLDDHSGNLMHSAHYGAAAYTTGKMGDKALQLDGSNDYLQLPTAIAHRDELTIALWIKWQPGNKWQRIFDFGNGEQQYMFLTANNADTGMMRLAAKNGGEEQRFDICSLGTYTWKHITLTIGRDTITAYVDGKERASTTDITIRPADFAPVCNYIGRSQFAADPLLKANIDDLQIYNYALSPDEVATLYATGTTAMQPHTAEATAVSTCYYTLDGKCHPTPQQGINIARTQYADGTATVEKIISK